MKKIVVAIAACFLVGCAAAQMQASAPIDTVGSLSCSSENAQCLAFCNSSGRGSTCTSDCQNRMTQCLQTGKYFWITSPVKYNLRRE